VATTQQLLEEARNAYHRLMTGTQVVEFRDQNGEMMRYNFADAKRLEAYILTLEDKISPNGRASGPMQVFF
jgi:hypothetical protein